MITLDTIRPVPLFAALDEVQRARVADHAAELLLNPGEYAVYEGEMPAFFFILAGTLEMTKQVGLVEQVVRACNVGDYFGEMPILMGTASPAGVRATTPSQVLRLEAQDFRQLVAGRPAFAQAILAELARSMTGLQEFALKVPTSRVTLSGPRWNPVAYRLRDFLARNNVLFTWQVVEERRGSPAEEPPISARLNDGTVLTNPTIRDLATRLGIQTAPARQAYDLAIVGAGPAGLSAAVYGASEGLATLLLEREAPGGQVGTSSRIENYLGFPAGISGNELGRRAFEQAMRLGAKVVITREVLALHAGEIYHELVLDGGDVVRARAVLLATGVDWRRLAVPDIDRFLGCGVYYGAARTEALAARGQAVYLVGGGNSAGQAAMFFANYAQQVTLLVRKPDLSSSMSQYLIDQLATKSNIQIEANSEVLAVEGAQHLEAIAVLNHATQQTTRRATNALFVFIGADVNLPWLPAAVACNGQGYVLTGAEVRTRAEAPRWPLARDPFYLETSLPGLFAAGDVRAGSVKRVASGVGEGSVVVSSIHAYLATAPVAPPPGEAAS
ncbi:cyclic nucleotide-binding domain-containing protein [Hymenobacter sp. HMF4947]|uniref:Cyclic nucleotide-binding domain-containing protein n=1 Tax=Hymenobacter ginkgonis TaxID=2682976 RepID=A0A7K1TGN1_9BACT|nr:cyclic nucleotide-binding domain-containing thioredoxin-disulfide reductase [Hymenobacter ginkgonis]MVN77472.1 cyclic nucleotide-binding domain-containing protein [Hymenobacter ginkgonis]